MGVEKTTKVSVSYLEITLGGGFYETELFNYIASYI